MCASFAAQAQKVNVTGTVKDSEGEALVGANVVVNNTMLGVITNRDGVFELALDERNSYGITISYMGYETVSFNVAPPFNDHYDVELQTSVFIADEVVVQGHQGRQQNSHGI